MIVPVYRAEKYINQCVDSMLGSTYRNIEVILMDDGVT
ncbi:MAG: glycosyltransferase family 2 protein [Bacteroidaceae bacterium]|nr:glycosyltransferase family 2 protein [Bacteroidaceae bacterium]